MARAKRPRIVKVATSTRRRPHTASAARPRIVKTPKVTRTRSLLRGETGANWNRPMPKATGWMASDPAYQASVAARGRWFAPSLGEARYYLRDNEKAGTGIITRVRVTERQYKKYRVSNFPGKGKTGTGPRSVSARPDKEWFLPRNVADTRKVAYTVRKRTASVVRRRVIGIRKPMSAMNAARRKWAEALHPRQAKGTPGGGKFRRK